MKKTFIFIVCIILSVIFLNAFTTTQKAIVKNSSKQQVIEQLEKFVVMKGYRFKYGNPQQGLFDIYVRTTTTGGYYTTTQVKKGDKKETIERYEPIQETEWSFSVQINQNGPDVSIAGSSRGDIAPGRYFKEYLNFMKDAGMQAYFEKDYQKMVKSGEIIETKQSNTPSGVNTSVSGVISPQPPAGQINNNPALSIIDDIEIKTFGKYNRATPVEERLSLLELHYFNQQLLNLSVDSRIKAIQNRMAQNEND